MKAPTEQERAREPRQGLSGVMTIFGDDPIPADERPRRAGVAPDTERTSRIEAA